MPAVAYAGSRGSCSEVARCISAGNGGIPSRSTRWMSKPTCLSSCLFTPQALVEAAAAKRNAELATAAKVAEDVAARLQAQLTQLQERQEEMDSGTQRSAGRRAQCIHLCFDLHPDQSSLRQGSQNR